MGILKNWRYNDIVLYSKGWYERSNDICKDLGYLFSKVYAWTPKREDEIAAMMLRVLDSLYKDLKLSGPVEKIDGRFLFSHYQLECQVRNNMRLYNSSRDTAIIRTVMDVLFSLTTEDIKLNPPKFGKKEHFRLGNFFGNKLPKSTTYTYMNRYVKNAFKNVE